MSKLLTKMFSQTDGVLVNTLHCTGHNEVTGVITQPSQKLILQRNAELRKNPGSLRDLSFGRQIASIPLLDYLALRAKYPKLADRSDAKRYSAELIRVLKMPENKEFLVRNKV